VYNAGLRTLLELLQPLRADESLPLSNGCPTTSVMTA